MPHKECRTCEFMVQLKDVFYCVQPQKPPKEVKNIYNSCESWKMWRYHRT